MHLTKELSPVFVFSPPPPRKNVADKENAQHRTIRVAQGWSTSWEVVRWAGLIWSVGGMISVVQDLATASTITFMRLSRKQPGCSQWWITGGWEAVGINQNTAGKEYECREKTFSLHGQPSSGAEAVPPASLEFSKPAWKMPSAAWSDHTADTVSSRTCWGLFWIEVLCDALATAEVGPGCGPLYFVDPEAVFPHICFLPDWELVSALLLSTTCTVRQSVEMSSDWPNC